MTNLDASAPRTHNLAYPKTLEALKSATNRERAVGEALFEECGGRSGAGQKDGSRAGVEAARAEFIEVHGEHDLPSVEVLCRWKNVAQSFRGCWDNHNVSWGAREVAGTPNQLTEIVHRLNNPAPSRDDIRAAKKIILAETREAKRLTDLAAAEKEANRFAALDGRRQAKLSEASGCVQSGRQLDHRIIEKTSRPSRCADD